MRSVRIVTHRSARGNRPTLQALRLTLLITVTGALTWTPVRGEDLGVQRTAVPTE